MPRRIIPVCIAAILIISIFCNIQILNAEEAGSSFGGGNGTMTDPYIIEDVWDLQNMSGNLDAHYILGNDIDASVTTGWDSGAGFLPIGSEKEPFIGSLDGKGHAIRGLCINRPNAIQVGLFGYTGPACTIENIVLYSANVTGNHIVGGLVGINRGTVYDIYIAGVVSGSDTVGGLVGWNDYGNITSSYATGNVTGPDTSFFGGLIGLDNGNVSGCIANSTVSCKGDFSGGLVGFLWNGTLSNSHAKGNVTGMWGVGGIAGAIQNCTITNSFAMGNVVGNDDIGGLVGHTTRSSVFSSFACGRVTGVFEVGGLIGYHGESIETNISVVSDCYATGAVNGTHDYSGGLVGYNFGIVAHSYSIGKVARTGIFGGLVGSNDDGLVDACFWDNETSGVNESAGGSARTTAEMKTRDTFVGAGWDFIDRWSMEENVTYPLLTWQTARPPKANAGPDQNVSLGTDGRIDVLLDGTGSTGSIGPFFYRWSFDYQDSEMVLYGATADFPFRFPGVYDVTLTVMDAIGNQGTDSMIITVSDVTPPVADAGSDRTVPIGSTVTLDGSASTDNGGLASHSWEFIYDEQPRMIEGTLVQFNFDDVGSFEITLTVIDSSGNQANDSVVITVVDLGRVIGTVHDSAGRSVEHATVKIIMIDGRTFSTTTAANGSFAIDVPQGTFSWEISKKGYKSISGSSSVKAMEETELDLSDSPMFKEDEDSTVRPTYLMPTVVIVLLVIGLVVILLLKKKTGKIDG